MPLVADTAIVTQAQVEGLTHEGSLTNLDAGNATLATLLNEATNALIRGVRKRSVDPALITNTNDLRAAASYWILWTLYSSQPQGDEEIVRKTELYRLKWEREIAEVVLQTTDAGELVAAPKGLPRAVNLDAVPYISNGVDNRVPRGLGGGRDSFSFFKTE